MSTLFFRESEFEGKVCQFSVANYLAFLSMRGPDIADEVSKLKAALSEPTKEHLERDLCLLLRARNWRFHNIACVAIACCGATDQLLSELWECIKKGSWTSPQLAATAAFADQGFSQRAQKLVAHHETYFKSIVALAALVEDRAGTSVDWSKAALDNISEAKQIDRDNSGSIAISWNGNLQAAFGAA